MLKLTKTTTLYSKFDVANYIAASMALAVHSQLQVLADPDARGAYNDGWLETFKIAQVEANKVLDERQGLLYRLPYLTSENMDQRLAFFVEIQRVRARVAFRRNKSVSNEAALDAWNTWAIVDASEGVLV